MTTTSKTTILTNRLRKNFQKMSKLKTTAYRLYDKDIPEIPYLIDRYNDYFVLYEKGKKIEDEEGEHVKDGSLEAIKESLFDLFNVDSNSLVLKIREKKSPYEKGERPNNEFITTVVEENNIKLEVRLGQYMDTGLFIDHRPLRLKIQKLAPGKKVLNLFSYTCSFGVHAARNGAITTNVDLSNTYLTWGEKNYALNKLNIEDHRFIQDDVASFFRKNQETFDIIVLDPPTFSVSKRMDGTLDIQRDHIGLIKECLKRLSPNGVLYFSTNLRSFRIDPSVREFCQLKDITMQTLDLDIHDKKIHQCFEIKA